MRAVSTISRASFTDVAIGFTQYVLACPESGYRYRCMVLVRGTHAYRIDFAVRKKFLYRMVNLASILLSQFPGRSATGS